MSGLWGKPTVVNNVETLCNVPHIVNHGAAGSRASSRSDDGGTKLYGVSGKVKRPGLWELPMGTPIREILEEHAGGMRDGYRFRGLLPGGASTDFLVEEHLDVPMDFDSMQKAGSRLGTGTMIVLDDQTCPVGMRAQPRALLRAGILRLVHAVPDGLPWVGTDPASDLEEGHGQPGDLERLAISCALAGPGTHVLRAGARRRGAAAERAEVFRATISNGTSASSAAPGDEAMATIYIDNRALRRSRDGENLLHACLSLGFNLPYFCWHPALGSVGACRQCAVKQFKDEEDTRGKIVMACMTPAADGTRISIDDPEAREFRASVIEWLMINHPHDCPVCDEGGECHLQDMTVMTGHAYRRYRVRQAHVPQPVPRAVRQPRDEPLHPVLPLRALLPRLRRRTRSRRVRLRTTTSTSAATRTACWKTSSAATWSRSARPASSPTRPCKQHYTRKWDLQIGAVGLRALRRSAATRFPASATAHCGASSTATTTRSTAISSATAGASATSSSTASAASGNRVLRKDRNAPLQSATKREALAASGRRCCANGGKPIGIGSPRASIEANFALRTLVGPERFYAGVSERDGRLLASMLDILRQGPARSPSLHEVELADAVLVLGEDVTNTAPLLALALRQSVRRQPQKIAEKMHIPHWNDHAVREAVQQERGPLFIATIAGTKLDDVATQTFRGAPDDLARLGFAVAHALDSSAPPVTGFARCDAQAGRCHRRGAKKRGASSRHLRHGLRRCGRHRGGSQRAWALCNSGHPAELCFAVTGMQQPGRGHDRRRQLRIGIRDGARYR